MALQLINVGNKPNDGKGDTGRVGGTKINENFTDLYATRAQVNYIAVTSASQTITDAELVLGTNIIGVNYAGAVDIYLPAGIDSNKIITIKDESGAAGTYNITIQVT